MPSLTASIRSRLQGVSARQRVAVIVAVVVAAVSTAYFWAVNVPFEHIDLAVYRFAVLRWFEGGDIYGELPPVNDSGFRLPFIYPPFATIPAIPFALLPFAVSYTLLFALNIACIVGTVYFVGRRIAPDASRMLTLAFAGGSLVLLLWLEPLRETFSFGQINLLLMGLVAIDCLPRRTRWPRGIGVGIAAAIKLTPAVFVLYFLVRRDYRAAAVSVLTGAVATALGFVVNWSGSVAYWFGGFAGADRINGSTFKTNQTVQGALARLRVDDLQLTIALAVAIVLLLVLTVVVIRTCAPEIGLLACAVFALLISPTAWSHHWVWVAPALVVMAVATVRAWRRESWSWYLLFPATVFTATAFVIAPFHNLPGNDDWGDPPIDLEQFWTPLQHVVGNVYVLAGIGWLIAAAVSGAVAHRRARARSVSASS